MSMASILSKQRPNPWATEHYLYEPLSYCYTDDLNYFSVETVCPWRHAHSG